nr:hypothetical transcript [Hymenolepis microstoma]
MGRHISKLFGYLRGKKRRASHLKIFDKDIIGASSPLHSTPLHSTPLSLSLPSSPHTSHPTSQPPNLPTSQPPNHPLSLLASYSHWDCSGVAIEHTPIVSLISRSSCVSGRWWTRVEDVGEITTISTACIVRRSLSTRTSLDAAQVKAIDGIVAHCA